MTNDPESYRAYDLIGEHFPPKDDQVNELVVFRSSTSSVDEPAFRARVEALVAALEQTGATSSVHSYYETGERTLVAPPGSTYETGAGSAYG